MPLADLANPTRFLALAGRLIPWLAGLTVVLFAGGLALVIRSPADYLQGETVRIMYIHVPAAWLSMLTYAIMAVSALGTLVWRHPLADVAARAAAPIGATFTALALVTGSLWGRPMWGTYWNGMRASPRYWCCSSCISASSRSGAPLRTRRAAHAPPPS